VRGYYNGLDDASISKLAKDIGLLMLEKEKGPSKPPFDPLLMGVFFAITLVVTIIVVSIIFRKKKA
jgi:protein SCO1/2